jgi:hypothetical protein
VVAVWLQLLGAVGHDVSTVAVDLCWLASPRAGGSLAGLDVGTAAVMVTATAALALCARSHRWPWRWAPAWPLTSLPPRTWPPSST